MASSHSDLIRLAIAASAFFGPAVQFGATMAAQDSASATLWILLRYFTVWVNEAVALGFTGLALGRPASPALPGGVTLNSLLVAVVYNLLLAGTLVQTGPERLSNLCFHSVMPTLVLLFWLMRVRRGALLHQDVAPWTAAPLLYLAVALARGAADGIYPYPLLDIARFIWAAVDTTPPASRPGSSWLAPRWCGSTGGSGARAAA